MLTPNSNLSHLTHFSLFWCQLLKGDIDEMKATSKPGGWEHGHLSSLMRAWKTLTNDRVHLSCLCLCICPTDTKNIQTFCSHHPFYLGEALPLAFWFKSRPTRTHFQNIGNLQNKCSDLFFMFFFFFLKW